MQPHSITTRSEVFQSPVKYRNLIMSTSRNIFTDASITFNLDPSTSFHWTGTYPISTLNIVLNTNSSMSNAHLSICKGLNSILADSLVKSLNPHWVSSDFTPHTTFLIKPKTADTSFRWNFRSTFDYSSRWLRDPTTIISGWPTFCLISYNFFRILINSEKVVAPSASTISIWSPEAAAMPALTAPPLPLFLGYSTTNKLAFFYLPFCVATCVVLSLDPSLTTMIS